MSLPADNSMPFDSFDCDGGEGPWVDLRDEIAARRYAEINREMAERFPEAYATPARPRPNDPDEVDYIL